MPPSIYQKHLERKQADQVPDTRFIDLYRELKEALHDCDTNSKNHKGDKWRFYLNEKWTKMMGILKQMEALR